LYRSVRFRLTCWYVGILALILLVFSTGVYSALSRRIDQRVNDSLSNSVDMFSRTLTHEIEENDGGPAAEAHFREVIETVYRDSFPGQGIAVYAGSRLVTAKPGPGGVVPPDPQDAAPRIRIANVSPAQGPNPERQATVLVRLGKAGDYAVISSLSLTASREELQVIRSTFLMAIAAALVALALGGYLLARKSLQPVMAISETAERISSKDLTQRVLVINPRDELGRLATTFNSLLDRLEKSFERQKQFMADSSHELRTPIYVASTAAQVALELPVRDEHEYREALATIVSQLKRLSHLVENMFVLARADAGVYPVDTREFYLEEAISECVRAASVIGQRSGTKVVALPAGEAPCRGDEGLIRQLIMILLDNAVKHSGENALVEASLDASNSACYSVTVRDTGPGIPEETRALIFDRFFRGDKSRSRSWEDAGYGAGLGLAIGKWIAELHGGGLMLEDSGPQGSTFRATIQRAPSPSGQRRDRSLPSQVKPTIKSASAATFRS
jgi:heavy metal sensor kinase